MINMNNVKQIFDDDRWISRSSLLEETVEVFENKDGTICGGEEDNVRFDGVEYDCSVQKLFRIVEAAKRKWDHNWTGCCPNDDVEDVWDIENKFELNVLFVDDESIGRLEWLFVSQFDQR